MRTARARRTTVATASLALILFACAPVEEDPGEDEGSAGDPASAPDCAVDDLDLVADGRLTVGTDDPAYEPYFVDDDPTNGEGFESAVAYAVAEEMGFAPDEVDWTVVKFNNSFQPGAKPFDFDINQISITPARAQAVTFSQGYYSASQAIISLKDGPYADAASLAELKDARLGAQIGTTSLEAVEAEIDPGNEPQVFNDTSAAKQALLNGQVDAIVADLPTAFYITAVEIPAAQVVGQFQVTSGKTEEFGLLLEKDNPLVTCVDAALTTLKEDGTLEQIERKWLSDAVDVPTLS
ncbi:MAG: amino acid ABC transporter substrate-binding protein [Nocardioidaceae bacterium]|nr:amino acid ABC transporter substrate-binding protein [Nocardioidaceae bacterium]